MKSLINDNSADMSDPIKSPKENPRFSSGNDVYTSTAVKCCYPHARLGYGFTTEFKSESAVIERGFLGENSQGITVALVTYRITSGDLIGTKIQKEYLVGDIRSDCNHLMEVLTEFFPSRTFPSPNVSILIGQMCKLCLLLYIPYRFSDYLYSDKGPSSITISAMDVAGVVAIKDAGISSSRAPFRTGSLGKPELASKNGSVDVVSPITQATNVKIGQIWTDSKLSLVGGRSITVQAIDSTHAVCRSTRSPGSNLTVRILLDRFAAGKEYVLVQDAPCPASLRPGAEDNNLPATRNATPLEANTSAPRVKVGQVWRDGWSSSTGGRTITVEAVEGTRAICRSSRANNIVKIRLDRFVPGREGYVLVQHVVSPSESNRMESQ